MGCTNEIQISKAELDAYNEDDLFSGFYNEEIAEEAAREFEHTFNALPGSDEIFEEEPSLKLLHTALEVKNSYQNTTKVMHGMKEIDEKIDQGAYKVETLPEQGVMVVVDLLSDPNIKVNSHNLTAFDMAVADAVYTLKKAGYAIVSDAMIFRVITGNLNYRARKENLGLIEESMRRLKATNVKIDYTDEMMVRKRGKTPDVQHYASRSSIVDYREEYFRVGNGIKVKAYVLYGSCLYEYAEAVGQIACIPLSYLATSSLISDCDETIVIKRYLIKRILMIKNPKNRRISNRIIYEKIDYDGKRIGMFEDLGFKRESFKTEKGWLNKRSKLHKTIIGYLEKFKNDGLFTDYTIIRSGRLIVGIEIAK